MHLLLPLAFTLSPLLGWAAGWPWLTVLLAAAVLPLAEWLVGRAGEAPDWRWGEHFPRGAMLAVLATCSVLPLLASDDGWTSWLPLALGSGYVAGGIGIVLAHELAHRRPFADRLLARALLCLIGFGHYALEHNRGHHRAAATRPDPATARRDESLWGFMPRYFSGVFRDALRLAREAPGRLNEALALAGLSLAMAAGVAAIGGLPALAFLAVQALVAQALVAAVDYIEHWGLERAEVGGRPERMGPQHTWDCANSVSDAMLFNLPRHAAHHMEPSLDCDELYRVPASPQMPTGYAGMVLLAFVSPLYRRIMLPRLPGAPAAAGVAAA